MAELAVESKVQVAEEELVVRKLNLELVLNWLLVLLKGFLVDLDKITYSLFHFVLVGSQVRTYEGKSCLEYRYPNNDPPLVPVFVADSYPHPRLHDVLVHGPQGVYPFLTNKHDQEEPYHLHLLDEYVLSSLFEG